MSMSVNLFAAEPQRWQAVVQRDRRADSAFVYAVRSTGIYCRPSCASRQPRREQVRFFDDPQQAEQAGFRACKRCNPRADISDDPRLAAIRQACTLIEQAETAPRLAELARAVGLSPSHLQRRFKAVVGVSPQQYAMSLRKQQLQQRLSQDPSVTEAIYNAGFGSSSHFYAQSQEQLGMTATRYRQGAAGEQIRYAIAESYLGQVLVAATARGLCAIEFADSAAELLERLQRRFPQATLSGADHEFTDWVTQTLAFLEAPAQGLALPLDIQGTAFQQRVWQALRTIPAGTSSSYRTVAEQLGNPKAVRAVAQACAANTLAVAIPCHRVQRSDGELGGYRWGLERKRALLAREAGESGS